MRRVPWTGSSSGSSPPRGGGGGGGGGPASRAPPPPPPGGRAGGRRGGGGPPGLARGADIVIDLLHGLLYRVGLGDRGVGAQLGKAVQVAQLLLVEGPHLGHIGSGGGLGGGQTELLVAGLLADIGHPLLGLPFGVGEDLGLLASASFTSSSAIRWAVISALRMASSVARYSSTFSTRTFILLFKTAFSLYSEV